MTLDRVNTRELKLVRMFSAALAKELTNADGIRTRLVSEIRAAYPQHTLQEIGDAAGLSRERVRQLLKEEA